MADRKCVLIVDDHAGVRRALRLLFVTNGFDVCGEAVNGVEAIRKAQELEPDLIILDLSMPIMNGIEAATQLAKLMPHVPLLLVTNHAGTIRDEELYKIGIVAIVPKSEASSKLIDCARVFLD